MLLSNVCLCIVYICLMYKHNYYNIIHPVKIMISGNISIMRSWIVT